MYIYVKVVQVSVTTKYSVKVIFKFYDNIILIDSLKIDKQFLILILCILYLESNFYKHVWHKQRVCGFMKVRIGSSP